MKTLDQKFYETFGHSDGLKRFFCPGRVNLIGEHIDYLGGSVMPAAISLGITAVCRPNDLHVLRVYSTDFDGITAFDLNALPDSKVGHWSDFVLGVMLHLKSKSITIKGCDILFDSNLPKASGLSSSAAMEVLNYYLIYYLNTGKEPNRVQMALDCQQIENRFIGVNCGIMDQFAVANGKQNHAIKLNCETLDHSFVPLHLGQHSLLIINSNKPRTLAESAYNKRRAECDEALHIIQQTKTITKLVEAQLEDLKALRNPILQKRARHAMTEYRRVLSSAQAIQEGRLNDFGRLMKESHYSLCDDFEVSCDELNLIVEILSASDACLGVRMTGAGFGGCCIALVDEKQITRISAQLEESYKTCFGFSPSFYTCHPSDGVRILNHE